MNKYLKTIIAGLAILISLLLHWHVFREELIGYHVWRQAQTQTTIQNFADKDMNIFNPRINNMMYGSDIYRMEFPLMQWLIALFYKIFGSYLVITRVVSFLIGLFSMAGMYKLAQSIFKEPFAGSIALWTFCFSPVFYYYTLNPFSDNLSLCFAIWGLAFFFRNLKTNSGWMSLSALICLSFAALCKLPFIVFFALPATRIILDARKNGLAPNPGVWKSVMCCGVVLLPVVAWYGAVIPSWMDKGNGVVAGLAGGATYQWSQIPDILFHNAVSTLPELLLNYGSLLFFFAGFYFLVKEKKQKDFLFPYLAICGAAVLAYFFFEMNMIAKVHDYYLFPFLPLLFLIVTYGALRLLASHKKAWRSLAFFALSILPLTAFLRADTRWNRENPGFNRDMLVYHKAIEAKIPVGSFCIAGNDESGHI
ncbi:MAG TPA: glycosyltransferase family 39 protein, partial [Bacteroidia bacterium]|nr:glycosyltransferase family 39 protein [Bacteroidia bacterium]